MFIYFIGDSMDEFYRLAEELRYELRNPYVGTEHFLLAYLKIVPNSLLSYEVFRNHIISVIGQCSRTCDYLLYTPKAREIRNRSTSIQEVVSSILNDKDSIGYHLLLSMHIEPNELSISFCAKISLRF